MATQTVDIAAFVNGAVVISFQYDDVTNRVLAIVGSNATDRDAFVALSDAAGHTASTLIGAHGQTNVAVPPGSGLTVARSGGTAGIDGFSCRWPA